MIIELKQPLVVDNNKFAYHHVDITIRHSHGGINYATYKQERSGYFMHFNPCNYRVENG